MFEGADFMRLGVGTSVLCYAHVNGVNFLTICGSVRVSRHICSINLMLYVPCNIMII
jgi:hypothetical protein